MLLSLQGKLSWVGTADKNISWENIKKLLFQPPEKDFEFRNHVL